MSRSVAKKDGLEPPSGCDRREEILDTATRLFAEHGFANADTQRLADELQVGKGTLYRNFPSKRALFLAAVDRAMRRLHECVDASIADIQDPLERISRAVEAYLDFFESNPEYVELLIQERAQFKDRDTPTYFAHRERSVERWRALYRMLIADGRVRDVPVERITDVMTAAVYGAMFLKYFSGPSGAFQTRADDILDVVFHGILSKSERESGDLSQAGDDKGVAKSQKGTQAPEQAG